MNSQNKTRELHYPLKYYVPECFVKTNHVFTNSTMENGM